MSAQICPGSFVILKHVERLVLYDHPIRHDEFPLGLVVEIPGLIFVISIASYGALHSWFYVIMQSGLMGWFAEYEDNIDVL
jgi:hypothetical protein